MKSKKLIVIEDSSKSSFGGGQQVTLIVSDWWNREFGQVLVVDHINPFIPPSAFSAKCLSNRLSYLPILYSFFKISSTPKSSYSLTLIEYIFYPLLIPFNSLVIFFWKFWGNCILSRQEKSIGVISCVPYRPNSLSLP